jgi:putative SOS response-associated peptidase YedK
MCGRFTITAHPAALTQLFELPAVPELPPRYNVAPTQPVPVVRLGEKGRELSILRWGLIPSWSKDAKASFINARAETAADKPAFRTAFRRRRCLMPADGFYEWQQAGGRKQPWYFRLAGGQPFAFAGLWETSNGPDGVVQSCALLTTKANETVRPVHDRMPVVLAPADFGHWLEPTTSELAALLPLLRPYAGPMRSYPVGAAVHSPRNDGPACVAPLA